MKISRYKDESICINHKMTITLHDQTEQRCCLHVVDHVNLTSELKVLSHGEELVISDYNTVLIPIQHNFDAAGESVTTFAINHDPNVIVHRSEIKDIQ